MNCLETLFDFLRITFDLIKGISWPLAILLSVLFFKSEVKQLLPRLRKLGTGGLELDPRDQQQLPTPVSPVQTIDLSEATPAIAEIENRIRADLKNIIEERREPVLIRQLAGAQAAAFFENTYGLIFGSQIQALLKLSEVEQTSTLQAREYYEGTLRPLLPESSQETGFDMWSAFLVVRGLITLNFEKVAITELGKEFLRFLKLQNRPLNKPL